MLGSGGFVSGILSAKAGVRQRLSGLFPQQTEEELRGSGADEVDFVISMVSARFLSLPDEEGTA